MRAIHAVIGVWHRGSSAFYAKRSENMENYPGVWSLFSIQFAPENLRDFCDLPAVQQHMERMADERLNGMPITVRQHLSSTVCSDNPIDARVHLHLYEIELAHEPDLNPAYYTEGAWLTPEEYLVKSANATCGTCMRMWSDYCVKHRLSEIRFAPELEERHIGTSEAVLSS